jgi:aminopeptidase 2
MDWWNDLWLNEGFATWVGWYATDHIFPEWNVWSVFLDTEHHRGLGLDELKSSHAIQVTVNNPSEIVQIFDAISYAKGASIIRMLCSYLGDEAFLNGVRNYLEKYKYDNAVTKDLWNELSQSASQDVQALMNEWTASVGVSLHSCSAFFRFNAIM